MAKEKILVADDEPYVLDVCERILEKDFTVKIVRSGLEAIQVAQHERFDLLLTDIKMPGIDGLETAREIKKIHPNIISVTMTGYGTMETALKALRLGIDEFVIKPFAPEELLLALERALEKERLRQENTRLKSLLPLFEFNRSLTGISDPHLLFDKVLDLALSNTSAQLGALYVYNSQGRLSFLTQAHCEADHLALFAADNFAFLQQLDDDALQSTVGVANNSPFAPLLTKMGMDSIVAVPLHGKERSLGVFVLAKKTGGAFTQSELNFLGVLFGQAAVAYENARLLEDLQNTNEQLKVLDHLKSEFINLAAHELRTPLAILMGYASVVEEEVSGLHKEYLRIITRNAMRLRALIEDLLNMRNIEAGQLEFSVSPVRIDEIVAQSMVDVAILAREKNIQLETSLPDDLPVIDFDRQKLELIIMNLLTNAIKFTPVKGKVSLTGKITKDRLEFSVQDTGIGIPEKEFTHIFERFYQIENSLNREHNGIGLGLSIVKGIVDQCGGEIWVDSEPDKGSAFTFTLPYSSREEKS